MKGGGQGLIWKSNKECLISEGVGGGQQSSVTVLTFVFLYFYGTPNNIYLKSIIPKIMGYFAEKLDIVTAILNSSDLFKRNENMLSKVIEQLDVYSWVIKLHMADILFTNKTLSEQLDTWWAAQYIMAHDIITVVSGQRLRLSRKEIWVVIIGMLVRS